MRRVLFALLLLCGPARAAEIVDATGRTVTIPDHVTRILPAGPPAAVLLLTLAPDLMLGFPMDVSPEQRAYLSPEAAALPRIPRLTGKEDVTEQIRALKPDLIVDYGDVTPAYIELAKQTQERLGVPVILLDGALEKTPEVLRTLGGALHRDERAEALADSAMVDLISGKTRIKEFVRDATGKFQDPETTEPPSVMYLRGSDELRAVASDVGASSVFQALNWKVLAPAGTGSFRPVTLAQIAAFNPDKILFADTRMKDIVAASSAWRNLRAVREGNAYVMPAVPFGWIEEPPSINRLLGLQWLNWLRNDPLHGDRATELAKEATLFGSIFYDHTPTDAQLKKLTESALPIRP